MVSGGTPPSTRQDLARGFVEAAPFEHEVAGRTPFCPTRSGGDRLFAVLRRIVIGVGPGRFGPVGLAGGVTAVDLTSGSADALPSRTSSSMSRQEGRDAEVPRGTATASAYTAA